MNPLKDDIIYFGGSLVEGEVGCFSNGMGNDFSDIDVFIIREHTEFCSTVAVYQEEIRKIYFINTLRVGIDVEVFDSDYVSSLTDAIANIKLETNTRTYNVLKEYLPHGGDITLVNTFLNRLRNSVCVFNQNAYLSLISNIDFAKFLKLRISNIIALVDNNIPDVIGNLKIETIDVALFCIREIIIQVMTIALANEGLFVDRNKWVSLKFYNMSINKGKYISLRNCYFKIFRCDTTDSALCLTTINAAVKSIKQTIEDILMEDFEL